MLLSYPLPIRNYSGNSRLIARESRAFHRCRIIALVAGAICALPALASAQATSITNGSVTVGVDLSRGGSITLLKSNSDGRNLVNTSDLGREIQPSRFRHAAL